MTKFITKSDKLTNETKGDDIIKLLQKENAEQEETDKYKYIKEF